MRTEQAQRSYLSSATHQKVIHPTLMAFCAFAELFEGATHRGKAHLKSCNVPYLNFVHPKPLCNCLCLLRKSGVLGKALFVVPMVSFLPTTIFIIVDRNTVHLLLLLQRRKSPSKHSPERSLSCFFCCSISRETMHPLWLKKTPTHVPAVPSVAPCNNSS